MRNEVTSEQATAEIFADPVAYLARFGIEAELISDSTGTQELADAA